MTNLISSNFLLEPLHADIESVVAELKSNLESHPEQISLKKLYSQNFKKTLLKKISHKKPILSQVYHSIYNLPFNYENELEEINVQVDESTLNDRIFMWSILLFGCEKDLDMIKYFWSQTNHPVSCALAAMVIYQRIMNEKNFLNAVQNEKILKYKQQFQLWACDVINLCLEDKFEETQDLLLFKNEIFCDRNILNLAMEADSKTFLSLNACKILLDEIWFSKINLEISNFKLFVLTLTWMVTVLALKVFKYDFKDQENEVDSFYNKNFYYRVNNNEKFIQRYFYFLNSPIIKHIYHTIFYITFLALYTYVLVFDFYPRKDQIYDSIDADVYGLTIAECVTWIWIFSFAVEEINKILHIPRYNAKNIHVIITPLKCYFKTDLYFNSLEVINFLVLSIALVFRMIPSNSKSCFTVNEGESCFDIGRVFFSIGLMLSYLKLFRFLTIVSYFGTKFLILRRMAKLLIFYVVLLFLTVTSYAAAFQSVIFKSQKFDFKIIRHGFYLIFCKVYEQIDNKSIKFLNKMRYEIVKDFDLKTAVPPPFSLIETMIYLALISFDLKFVKGMHATKDVDPKVGEFERRKRNLYLNKGEEPEQTNQVEEFLQASQNMM